MCEGPRRGRVGPGNMAKECYRRKLPDGASRVKESHRVGGWSLGDQYEDCGERGLARCWIELSNERPVTRSGHPDVYVWWATEVPNGEVGLVPVAALGVGSLRRPMVVIVAPTRIDGPPLDPGARNGATAGGGPHRPGHDETLTGVGPFRSIRLVEGSQGVGGSGDAGSFARGDPSRWAGEDQRCEYWHHEPPGPEPSSSSHAPTPRPLSPVPCQS